MQLQVLAFLILPGVSDHSHISDVHVPMTGPLPAFPANATLQNFTASINRLTGGFSILQNG
jgi:hypothetical protein